MAYTEKLFDDITLERGETKRLYPEEESLDVSNYERLHFHIGTVPGIGINGLEVKIIYATIVKDDYFVILASSTVWFEDTKSERDFKHQVTDSRGTGFTMSVPVVAPLLFDVILENHGSEIEHLYVTLMAQEI